MWAGLCWSMLEYARVQVRYYPGAVVGVVGATVFVCLRDPLDAKSKAPGALFPFDFRFSGSLIAGNGTWSITAKRS